METYLLKHLLKPNDLVNRALTMMRLWNGVFAQNRASNSFIAFECHGFGTSVPISLAVISNTSLDCRFP
jgi:hypothetical protein